jgi:AICAR transformylase/IMP cyclohydrolase PurH
MVAKERGTTMKRIRYKQVKDVDEAYAYAVSEKMNDIILACPFRENVYNLLKRKNPDNIHVFFLAQENLKKKKGTYQSLMDDIVKEKDTTKRILVNGLRGSLTSTERTNLAALRRICAIEVTLGEPSKEASCDPFKDMKN